MAERVRGVVQGCLVRTILLVYEVSKHKKKLKEDDPVACETK